MKEYLLDKLIDWMDESFEAHRQLAKDVQELQDAIFKELHLEQICKWLVKILHKGVKNEFIR